MTKQIITLLMAVLILSLACSSGGVDAQEREQKPSKKMAQSKTGKQPPKQNKPTSPKKSKPKLDVRALEQLCRNKKSNACLDVGFAYLRGTGVKADAQKANQYLSRACDLRQSTGCLALGYNHAVGHGFRKDAGKANALYKKA